MKKRDLRSMRKLAIDRKHDPLDDDEIEWPAPIGDERPFDVPGIGPINPRQPWPVPVSPA